MPTQIALWYGIETTLQTPGRCSLVMQRWLASQYCNFSQSQRNKGNKSVRFSSKSYLHT